MAFKLKSGNKTSFKDMGSSPAKDMKTGSYAHSFEDSPAKQGPPSHEEVSEAVTRKVLKKKTYPKGYTKKDVEFLKKQREDVVRYEDLDEKGKAIWKKRMQDVVKKKGMHIPKKKKSPAKQYKKPVGPRADKKTPPTPRPEKVKKASRPIFKESASEMAAMLGENVANMALMGKTGAIAGGKGKKKKSPAKQKKGDYPKSFNVKGSSWPEKTPGYKDTKAAKVKAFKDAAKKIKTDPSSIAREKATMEQIKKGLAKKGKGKVGKTTTKKAFKKGAKQILKKVGSKFLGPIGAGIAATDIIAIAGHSYDKGSLKKGVKKWWDDPGKGPGGIFPTKPKFKKNK